MPNHCLWSKQTSPRREYHNQAVTARTTLSNMNEWIYRARERELNNFIFPPRFMTFHISMLNVILFVFTYCSGLFRSLFFPFQPPHLAMIICKSDQHSFINIIYKYVESIAGFWTDPCGVHFIWDVFPSRFDAIYNYPLSMIFDLTVDPSSG